MFETNRLSLQIIASKVDWLQLVSKWFIVFINTLSFKQVTSCSMHSIVTTFRGAVIKVEVANFCAAMDTLIDQDDFIGHTGSVEYQFDKMNPTKTVNNKISIHIVW